MNFGSNCEQRGTACGKIIAVALGIAVASGMVALNASKIELLERAYAGGHGGGHSGGGRGGGGGHSTHSDQTTGHAGHGGAGRGGEGSVRGTPSHEIPHRGGTSTLEERVFRESRGAGADQGGRPPWAGETE